MVNFFDERFIVIQDDSRLHRTELNLRQHDRTILISIIAHISIFGSQDPIGSSPCRTAGRFWANLVRLRQVATDSYSPEVIGDGAADGQPSPIRLRNRKACRSVDDKMRFYPINFLYILAFDDHFVEPGLARSRHSRTDCAPASRWSCRSVTILRVTTTYMPPGITDSTSDSFRKTSVPAGSVSPIARP